MYVHISHRCNARDKNEKVISHMCGQANAANYYLYSKHLLLFLLWNKKEYLTGRATCVQVHGEAQIARKYMYINFFYYLPLAIIILPYGEGEGHGAMARARNFANVTACRAVSNPAWIFRDISCFSPLNIGTLFRFCVIRQCTSPLNATLDLGENE